MYFYHTIRDSESATVPSRVHPGAVKGPRPFLPGHSFLQRKGVDVNPNTLTDSVYLRTDAPQNVVSRSVMFVASGEKNFLCGRYLSANT